VASRVWVAATFTLGMLEPIEVLALGKCTLFYHRCISGPLLGGNLETSGSCTNSSLSTGIVFSLLTALFYLSLYKYFPAHFAFLRRRSAYYLYGDEATPVFTLDLKSIFSKARSVIAWTKSTLGLRVDVGNYTSEGLQNAAKEVVHAISSTASHVWSSTASTVVETAKAEL
jgi:hypothetical protein